MITLLALTVFTVSYPIKLRCTGNLVCGTGATTMFTGIEIVESLCGARRNREAIVIR